MTIAEFSAALSKKATVLTRLVMEAERETLKDAQAQAVALSSGPLSTRTLRRLGHPYARRNPTAAAPEIINAQTGRLRSSWHTAGPRSASGGIVSKLYNIDPNAKYMGGTRLMIPRPLAEAVKKAVQPKRIKRLQKAVQDALHS